MKITEIYPTIQGEGPYVGRAIIVLRTGVCNLQCSWCDTKYSWQKDSLPNLKNVANENQALSIINEIEAAGMKNNAHTILLTGGEPMIWQKDESLQYIINWFHTKGWQIHCETNGTVPLTYGLLYDFLSISPKVGEYFDSYKHEVMNTYLKHNHKVFKFVIGDYKDVAHLISFVNKFKLFSQSIWLMPRGTTPSELNESIDHIENARSFIENFDITFHVSERRHILLNVR
jgi:organic radical activating enzyme